MKEDKQNPIHAAGPSFEPEEGFIEWTSDTPMFHIGPGKEHPAQPIKCKRCLDHFFEVGMRGHFIAIRCAECKWELCLVNEEYMVRVYQQYYLNFSEAIEKVAKDRG